MKALFVALTCLFVPCACAASQEGKAFAPSPSDQAVLDIEDADTWDGVLRWSPGDGAEWHLVYFGTRLPIRRIATLHSEFPRWFVGDLASFGEGTYYWRVDEIDAGGTTHEGDLWTFSIGYLKAHDPAPADGAACVTEPVLSWSPGATVKHHEVYFGTEPDPTGQDPERFRFRVRTESTTYRLPVQLTPGQRYTWRVDEIEKTASEGRLIRYMGDLWTFTTLGGAFGGVRARYFLGVEPVGAPFLTQVEGPIDHDWGGGEIAGALCDEVSARWMADLNILEADTYTFITTSNDGVRLWLDGDLIIDNWTDHVVMDDVSDPIPLEAGIHYVEMEWYERTGNAVAKLSWKTATTPKRIVPCGVLLLPVSARVVYPRNGAVDVSRNVTLTWTAGEAAAAHTIYFGDDAEMVRNGTPASIGICWGQQALDKTSFTPGPLELGKTYYWRVDEVNDARADSPWKGLVWSFRTADSIALNDLESYTDETSVCRAGQQLPRGFATRTWQSGKRNVIARRPQADEAISTLGLELASLRSQ